MNEEKAIRRSSSPKSRFHPSRDSVPWGCASCHRRTFIRLLRGRRHSRAPGRRCRWLAQCGGRSWWELDCLGWRNVSPKPPSSLHLALTPPADALRPPPPPVFFSPRLLPIHQQAVGLLTAPYLCQVPPGLTARVTTRETWPHGEGFGFPAT